MWVRLIGLTVLTLSACATPPGLTSAPPKGDLASIVPPSVVSMGAVADDLASTPTAPRPSATWTPHPSPTVEPTWTTAPYWQTQDAAVVDVQPMRWDVGATPGVVGAPDRLAAISFFSQSNGWALGKDWLEGHDYKGVSLGYTTDGGASWQSRSIPDRGVGCLNGVADLLFRDERSGWLRCQGLLATEDGGASWTVLTSADPIIAWGRSPTGQLWAWMRADGHYSVLREPRPGQLSDWQDLITRWPNNDIGPSIEDARYGPSLWDAQSIVFAEPRANDGSMLSGPWWSTRDAGATWQSFALPCGTRGWPHESISPSAGSVLWAACGGMPAGTLQDKWMLRSLDAGSSWDLVGATQMTVPFPETTPAPQQVVGHGHVQTIVALSEATAYSLLGRASGPLITRDAGRTWNTPNLDPCTVGDTGAVDSVIDSLHMWIAGAGGLAKSEDGGASWTCYVFPRDS